MDQLQLAVVAVTEAWQFSYANPTAEALLGMTQSELLGRDARELLPALRGTPLWWALQRVMAARAPATVEHFCRSQHAWLRVRAYPLASGLMVYAANITRQKRLERSVRRHRERLDAMAVELSLAEERERRRIAEQLHDHIGQTLLLAKLKLRRLQESAPEQLKPELRDFSALVDGLIQDTRTLTGELSPPVLYEAGLEAAIRWLAGKAQRDCGFEVDVRADGPPVPLPQCTAIALFQTVRELLVNAAKHARAKRVRVSLWRSGSRLTIEVADDGVGFDAARHQADGGGLGLFLARQRLEHLGGTFRIESKAGHGARAVLTVRLNKRRSES